MPIARDKFEALNEMAEAVGTVPGFHPSMTTDQFFGGVCDIVLAIPAYVDKEVKRAIKQQDQE